VTKPDDRVIIEVSQTVAACEQIRCGVRDDGSGGQREVKLDQAWVSER
jgi:hypothetical protein